MNPTCCGVGKKYIKWMEKDYPGPEKDGWAMMVDYTCYERELDIEYQNVNFCPFCGVKLEHQP